MRGQFARRLRGAGDYPAPRVPDGDVHGAIEDLAANAADLLGIHRRRLRGQPLFQRSGGTHEGVLRGIGEARARGLAFALHDIGHETHHQNQGNERHEGEQQQERAHLLGADLVNRHGGPYSIDAETVPGEARR